MTRERQPYPCTSSVPAGGPPFRPALLTTGLLHGLLHGVGVRREAPSLREFTGCLLTPRGSAPHLQTSERAGGAVCTTVRGGPSPRRVCDPRATARPARSEQPATQLHLPRQLLPDGQQGAGSVGRTGQQLPKAGPFFLAERIKVRGQRAPDPRGSQEHSAPRTHCG